jgi:flagellar motor switch/type III secretory pathway protein FliN
MSSDLALAPTRPGGITEQAWREAGWLPCELHAEIPVRAFTVGDLLSLEVGSLLDTGTPCDGEVSVEANGARLGAGTLDVMAGHWAVRLTELREM